jgi:hypothetical protein
MYNKYNDIDFSNAKPVSAMNDETFVLELKQ